MLDSFSPSKGGPRALLLAALATFASPTLACVDDDTVSAETETGTRTETDESDTGGGDCFNPEVELPELATSPGFSLPCGGEQACPTGVPLTGIFGGESYNYCTVETPSGFPDLNVEITETFNGQQGKFTFKSDSPITDARLNLDCWSGIEHDVIGGFSMNFAELTICPSAFSEDSSLLVATNRRGVVAVCGQGVCRAED